MINIAQQAMVDGARIAYTDAADKMKSMLDNMPTELKADASYSFLTIFVDNFVEALRTKAKNVEAEMNRYNEHLTNPEKAN